MSKTRISMKMQHEGLTISFMLQPHPAPWPVVGASLPCWRFGPSFRALRCRSFNLTSIDPIPCPTVPTGWRPLFSVCHLDKPLLFFPRCALWSFECRILPFFALTIPWWWFNTPLPYINRRSIACCPLPRVPIHVSIIFHRLRNCRFPWLLCNHWSRLSRCLRDIVHFFLFSIYKIYLPLWLP